MTSCKRHREIAASVGERLVNHEGATAVLLVGSSATGYADEYSDVDLTVVGSVEPGEQTVDGVHVEWTTTTRSEIENTLANWEDDAALYTYAHAELLSDDVGVADLLATYASYPRDVRREKLFAGWFYGSGNALDARTAQRRGHDRVVRSAATSAVEQFVALTYVLDGSFPPYRKWLFRDPPRDLPRVDAALSGDISALDTLENAVKSSLREHLEGDRIDSPYLFEPEYGQLGQ